MKAMRSALRALVLVALAGYAVSAQHAPPAPAVSTPVSVGISTERLNRLHAGMQGFVDRKEAGGIVTLIARDGKVVDVTAVGFQDVAAKTPMRTDTLFRIASMTKPVTSVAVMMLYEEGRLLLTDPVSKFIPAFKSSRVLEGAAEAPVAARRGINLRDLLTHRYLEFIEHTLLTPESFDALVDRIAAREVEPYSAAEDLLSRSLKR